MKIKSRHLIIQIVCLAALASSIAPVNAQSVSAGERKHGFCIACHGVNGRSFKVNYPILAGQAAPYVLRQLRDFKEGRRSDPIMNSIMPNLSDEDMPDLAAFFAAQDPYSHPSEIDPAKAFRGKKKAENGRCASCHAARTDSSKSDIPRIHGQHRNYMMKQLGDFRAGRRTNGKGAMHDIAQSMTDADIEDLSNYFASIRFDNQQPVRQ